MIEPEASGQPTFDEQVPATGYGNFGGSDVPTADDDELAGYSVNSIWYKGSVPVRLFICVSNITGFAVWKEIPLTVSRSARAIFNDSTSVSTSVTTPENLYIGTIPAYTFFENEDEVRITYRGTYAGNGNNKTLKVYIDADEIFDTGALAKNGGGWKLEIELTRRDSDELVISGSYSDTTNRVVVTPTITSLDFTTLLNIILEAETPTAAGDVTLGSAKAWFIPAAPVDVDVLAFIAATGITDATIKHAISNLVIGLKAYSLWTKCNAIYPFAGGTAGTHKWNLKNPLDTNAAFRLTFSGGWTHSATGALPNGTTGYANTFLTPSTQLTLNNAHVSFYSRSNTTTGISIGTGSDGLVRRIWLAARLGVLSNETVSDFYYYLDSGRVNVADADSLGLYVSSRTANNALAVYKDGTSIGTNTGTSTSLAPSRTIKLGVDDQDGTLAYFDDKELAFVSIGAGLTSGEVADLYTIVQAFETAMGRNV